MNFGIKLRLAVLGVVVGLMGASIVMVVLGSQRRADELRASLNNVDSESFRIADHFRESLREVGNAMLRYQIERDTNTWEQFLALSHNLDLGIDEQAPKLTTQGRKRTSCSK